MTSSPAQHDPRDNRPGREDADQTPSLRGVEAGPQRHSDDPWLAKARDLVRDSGLGFVDPHYFSGIVQHVAAALRSVDQAAREECARTANRFQDIQGWRPGESRNALVCDIRDRIFSSIKD